MSQPDDSYELITSIRYDRNLPTGGWNEEKDDSLPFLFLKYHYVRLLDAADRHGWDHAKSVPSYSLLRSTCEKAISVHEAHSERADQYRIRVLLSKDGSLSATVSIVDRLLTDPFAAARFKPDLGSTPPGVVWSVKLDTQPTPSSIFTATKTTYRKHYDSARSRAGLLPPQQATAPEDVLLYNTDGELTESSISNIAIYRDGKWLTPPLATGCLAGVIRSRLLEHGLVEEARKGELTKDTIQVGEWVLLSNGVSACRLGRVKI
ncbi:hypothetical protein AX15_003168 [Amanita polypyramis BW_CC]|nr:hypothetical protein AX15_003168 [Amanita polypyramis BW_CC]